MSGDEMDEWINAALNDGWDPTNDGFDTAEFEDTNENNSPLSAEELAKARAELAEWTEPKAFRRRVDRLHKRSRSKEIFNDPKRNFLLDAWVLAELSKHKPFDQIRLADVDEEWPDGFARIESGELKIEVTSALFPGRHLGAEYRFVGRMQHDHVENWIKRAESIPGALEKAVSAKVEKHYGSSFALVVYLNISEYGIAQAETEQAIANIKVKYGASFKDLWILWKGKLY
jgi:hypothetical protein